MEKAIEGGDVACVIIEPGGARMGIIPTTEDFLKNLREVTRDNGVILIFDEVVTGFRDASGGAQERYNVIPDMATLGKILSEGYPGGAIAGGEEYMSLLEFREERRETRRVSHHGMFNANPLSAAAGNACLKMILEGRAHPAINRKGDMLKRGLNEVIEDGGIETLAWSTTPSIVHVGFGVSPEDLKVSDIVSYIKLRRKLSEGRRTMHLLEKALINRGYIRWVQGSFYRPRTQEKMSG
ncbi:MAG: aminotransferase class III-fold pyridoxal phosphate-dependent enzyme [Candidatus Bathyarchaeia archaeon]